MKKFFVLIPLLSIIVAGCSLTQNAANNQASTKAPLTEQEKTDNAKIEEWKKQVGEQTKENINTPAPAKNTSAPTQPGLTEQEKAAQLEAWKKQVSE